MKRKFFLIFPITTLLISGINLVQWQVFEFLLWLFATILVSLIFLPLAFKAEDKDVPVYQVFAPIILIPTFFSFFAIMDFQKIDFLTLPQVLIYGIVTGLLIFGGLLLIIGPNNKY